MPRPQRRRELLLALLPGVLILAPPRARAQIPGPAPADVIRNFYAVLLDVMQHAAALGPRGRYQRLEPLITRTCDIPFMARLTIGPGWVGLTPARRSEAARAYGRYVTAVYANRFDGYSGEKFEVLGEEKIRHGLLVKSRIVKSGGETIAIDYMVHDNAIGWQIRDVYETGAISELATQRSDFASILRAGGIDGLIATLNKKADALQG